MTAGAAVGGVRLAPLRGRALDGTPWRLPNDLPADRTLVLLAYRQRHQRDVDTWIDLAVSLGVPPTPRGAARPMATAVIEVPNLSARWLPARRFIDGGMAAGIRDPDVLARTVTAYGSPVAHRAACGFAEDGGEAMRAVVASPAGEVTFLAVGPPGPDARAVLGAALGLVS
ncbi:MAG: hypothetical protein RLZZ353_874 [Actinomycetota bacterium]